MNYDRARRQERVPSNPYAIGEADTFGLSYGLLLSSIRPLLDTLAAEGHADLLHRLEAAGDEASPHASLEKGRLVRVLRSLPVETLDAVVATARRGFGKPEHRLLRTLARHVLAERASDEAVD